jgi:hypothetical protein
MNYDIGIIGAGVAGVFSALKISKDYKNAKIIMFDFGRPPQKRRRQLEGFLGCLPNSDGKLYCSDLDKITNIAGNRRIKSAHNWLNQTISNIGNFKTIKDKGPSISLEKKIIKAGFKVQLNDYSQMYPKDIHALSKYSSDILENNKNLTCIYDTEVTKILKQKGCFHVLTDHQEYKCKKLIIATGRSGWRWSKDLFTNFGIIDNNNYATYGVRLELNSYYMKDFNKSNCSLIKENELEIGPLSWFGTVIPEDHVDLAISAFRSNEERWKSDKVSFQLTGHRYFENQGFQQTDRLGKLAFLLANDRIIKERVSSILNKRSKISIIPEYDWLRESLTELSQVIPDLVTKGYYHIPTIMPLPPKINLGNNLESEIDGMYVVGESAGIVGLLAAGVMGIVAANESCK